MFSDAGMCWEGFEVAIGVFPITVSSLTERVATALCGGMGFSRGGYDGEA